MKRFSIIKERVDGGRLIWNMIINKSEFLSKVNVTGAVTVDLLKWTNRMNCVAFLFLYFIVCPLVTSAWISTLSQIKKRHPITIL